MAAPLIGRINPPVSVFDANGKFIRQRMLGCYMKTLNSKLGLNSVPTQVSLKLVEDPALGDRFRLKDKPDRGIRTITQVNFGGLSLYGFVQSWNESVVDLAGTGVYDVRVTDTRPVLDAIQVFLNGSMRVDYGENTANVWPENADDITFGVRWSRIVDYVMFDASYPIVYPSGHDPANDFYPAVMPVSGVYRFYRYGDASFIVDLKEIPVEPRTYNMKLREYRIPGAAMSLSEVITQACEDNGLEWYVETFRHSGFYRIVVKTLKRTIMGASAPVNMDSLAKAHEGHVERRTDGFENRDALNRAVVVGSQRQFLWEVNGFHWEQFWGFHDKKSYDRGKPSRPRLQPYLSIQLGRFNDNDLDVIEKPIPMKWIWSALYGTDEEQAEIPEEYREGIRAYGGEYWGRKFYMKVPQEFRDSILDENGNYGLYVETFNAAPWEQPGFPANLRADRAIEKFCTDDGRWITFVELPKLWARHVQAYNGDFTWMFDTGMSIGTFSDEFKHHDSVYIGPFGKLYMKATCEIQDGYFILTLDQPLVTNVKVKWWTKNAEGGEGEPNLALGSSSSFIIHVAEADSPDQLTEHERTTSARVENIAKSWVAIIDKRYSYGPWGTDDFVPIEQRKHGKTRILVDTSISPWTFAERGDKFADMVKVMGEVAKAKIFASATQVVTVDSGELTVAGAPAVNLGKEIGTGANITDINIMFGQNGVRTTYKVNQFTGEFGRLERQYRELLDSLRRAAAQRLNTHFSSIDLVAVDKEVKTVKPRQLANNGVRRVYKMGPQGGKGKIVGRSMQGGGYNIERTDYEPPTVVQEADGTVKTYYDEGKEHAWYNVPNLAEPDGAGYLREGTVVSVQIAGESMLGPFKPYINHTPETFMPPLD